MLLNTYSTDKKAQQFLRARCAMLAFSMRLNADDVLSLAHYRIANKIAIDKELNDEKHFINTLKVIAFNSAIDIKEKGFYKNHTLEDPFCLPEPEERNYHNGDARELLKIIDTGIRNHFKKSDKLLEIYQYCIIDGGKYEDAATEFGMPLGTIKTSIWRVRQFACKLRNKLSA